MFSVNHKFSHQLALVQLPPLPPSSVTAPGAPGSAAGDQGSEAAAVADKLQRNRTHAIEANLVRIMKVRRTVAHQTLVADLLAQLPFDVAIPTIKDRIASLLERDFMERDKENPQVYHYVA